MSEGSEFHDLGERAFAFRFAVQFWDSARGYLLKIGEI